MAFGNFGGLGTSFPVRSGTPQSQQVEYLPDMNAWQTDWDARNRGISGLVQQQIEVLPGAAGFKEENWDILDNAGVTGVGGTSLRDWYSGNDYGGRSWQVGVDLFDQSVYDQQKQALEAEKQSMVPKFENRQAQQQAYNSMLGNGQKNAVMGAGYSNPGFGQVNGQTADPFAAPQVPGVDPSWSSGVYNPSGTYAPQTKQNGWGL